MVRAMRISVVPVPAPRQVRRDLWSPSPNVARYRAFKDALRLAGVKQFGGEIRVTFFIPMPSSWSRNKRNQLRGTAHTQRPDIDNLLKALLDAPGRDDAHVYSIQATKLWADIGAIDVTDVSS
jgi:Holliday junction resolvase RusA-like endonuclease